MKLYSDAALAKILDQEIFHQISAVADRLGVECYVVGGYVRDIFLSVRPTISTPSWWAAVSRWHRR